jgi:hypothetical protein
MDDFGLFSVLYLIIALVGFPYAYIDYGYRGIIAFYLVEQSVVCAVFVAGYWSVLRSGQDIIMFCCNTALPKRRVLFMGGIGVI